MIKQAIFSDESERFVFPKTIRKGEYAEILIRVWKDDKLLIYLCTPQRRYLMEHSFTKGTFAFYGARVLMSEDVFMYWFEIADIDGSVYYDKIGITDDLNRSYPFRIVPDFAVPVWAKGAVMYQIMVDRFAKGDKTNDVLTGEYYYIDRQVKRIEEWDSLPGEFDVANFYGGDLAGVMEKLSYLKNLGVEAIYFNPLFVSPSNHKYDTQDYDYIDPHIGKIINDEGRILDKNQKDNTLSTRYVKRVTDKENLEASNELFIRLVEMAHENGIKVIIDGVFNHCGSFNKWLDREGIYESVLGYDKGAYYDKNSPYHDFFAFKENDDSKWPKNDSYKGWWDHYTLPKLNYEGSEKLKKYILEIAAKWVSPPFNADGWRLDVAADLGESTEFNHSFWKAFRKTVKEANPEAVIIAEHYGSAYDWLQGDEWDTVMNYDAFMEPVSYFLTGMEKHSDSFDESAVGDGKRFEVTMRYNMSQFMSHSLLAAMNQLSNHDHSRFLTRTNQKVGRIDTLGSMAAGEDTNKAIYRNATIIQMTWPGAPTLYYGDEAGVVGFTDPDSRRTYPWDQPDYDLIAFTRDAISLHKYHSALRTGAFLFLLCEKDFISYARFDKKEALVVAVNSSDKVVEKDIPVWQAEIPMSGKMTQVMANYDVGYSIMHIDHEVKKGMLKVKLLPYGSIVFKG